MSRILWRLMRSGVPGAQASYPPVELWQASSATLPAGMTHTRASAALYRSGATYATQVYVSALTNVARFETLASAKVGLLIEGATTNLKTYSYDLTQSPWTPNSSPTLTLNATGLTGSANTASTVLDDGVGAFERVDYNHTVATGTLTELSELWILKDGTTSRFPELQIQTTNNIGQQINTSTGATNQRFVAGWTPTVLISDMGLWWRMAISGSKANAETSRSFRILPAAGSTLGGGVASAVGSIVVPHAHFQYPTAFPYPTTPIQTAGSTGTRAADVTAKTVTPPAGGFALAFEIKTGSAVVANQFIFCMHDGSDNNKVECYVDDGVPTLVVTSGGSGVASITAGTVAASTERKISVSIAANSMNICNASTPGTRDTSCAMPVGLTTLILGHDRAGAQHLNGHIISGPNGSDWLASRDDAGLISLNS